MSGYFLVSRKLADPQHDLHPVSTGDAACRAFAWVDMIGMAKWRDGGGLERGQLRGSVRFLASRWNWSTGKTSRFLNNLEEKGRIVREQQSRTRASVITICNYSDYQNQFFADESDGGTAAEQQRGLNVNSNGHKEEDRKKNTEEPPSIVSPLWDVWVDEVWDGETDRRLTPKRRKKLEMVWKEHLDGRDDPVEFFRKMVRAMLADDWWGPKPSTHLPEKAMRNIERREDWKVAAEEGTGDRPHLTAQQVAERYGND